MLYIRNDFEIINLLLEESLHLRAISKKLDLVPSTAMRLLRRLQEERVVDFRREGKNNKYFLKLTPERYQYELMTEEYKLIKAVQNKRLRRTLDELREETGDELIILFGSFAKGLEHDESDIDIYIETNDEKLIENLSMISDVLSIKSGKFDKKSFLGKEICKNHIIVQNAQRWLSLKKEMGW